MSCDCDLSKGWNRPYVVACKLINDNDTIIDVGCADGKGLHMIKTHLKTHGKDVITIGIDAWSIENEYDWSKLPDRILEKMGGLDFLKQQETGYIKTMDEFINKPVERVYLDEIADIVLCFGFPDIENKYDRKESYRRMAEFLKPNGKAIYEVYKVEKSATVIFRRILNILGWNIPIHYTWKEASYVKRMTKQQAIDHAETCIICASQRDGDHCNHGIVLDVEQRCKNKN